MSVGDGKKEVTCRDKKSKTAGLCKAKAIYKAKSAKSGHYWPWQHTQVEGKVMIQKITAYHNAANVSIRARRPGFKAHQCEVIHSVT